MEKLVQVKLRESGAVLFYKCLIPEVKIGDYVIVEADRGLDYGNVVSESESTIEDNKEKPSDSKKENDQEGPVRKILRLAGVNDLKQIDDNKVRAKEAYKACMNRIENYKLQMKLIDCEYSFDRSKIIFYFTAEGRVDFRELVKELARVFKARIELRQIGVRDEAKLFGGFGSCGRELCCKTFLKDFEPVMIRMAKDQGLPLNPPKISGLCGRLMCCLSYEHSIYKKLSKDLPKEGDRITIPEGKGKVISVNILKRTFVVGLEDGRHVTVKRKSPESSK